MGTFFGVIIVIAWTGVSYSSGKSTGKSEVRKSAAGLLVRMYDDGRLDHDQVHDIGRGIGITDDQWWLAERYR